MHCLVNSTIRMARRNSFSKPVALMWGRILAITSNLSTASAKKNTLLQVPDNAEILILKYGDIKSGSGVLRIPAGLYAGSWDNTTMTSGKLTTPAGGVVQLCHQNNTEITFKNGYRYSGEVDSATLLPHGKGKMQLPKFLYSYESSLIYEGMFEAGKYHGEGELTVRKLFGKKLVYAGNFVEGEREGWVTVSEADWPRKTVRYERWEGGRCVEVIKCR